MWGPRRRSRPPPRCSTRCPVWEPWPSNGRPADMDALRFTQGMQLLSSVFDPDAISEQKVRDRQDGYWLALNDLDAEAFLAACVRATRTLTFFPKPVELLDAARALATERERAALADDYAERLRRSEAALEAERAERFGRWDAERRVLVRPDGSTAGTPPLPAPEEGVA